MIQSYCVTLECVKTSNQLTLDVDGSSAYEAQQTAEGLFNGFHAISIRENQEDN